MFFGNRLGMSEGVVQQTTKIISFIGFFTSAMSLVDLPSNPGKRMLAEVVIIMSAAGVIHAVHYSIHGMIMQASPPRGAEILSWVAMTVFIVSYIAFRITGGLWKIRRHWSSKSSRIAAFTIVFAAGLVLLGIAYPYFTEPDQFQVYSLSDDVSEEHTESNLTEPSRHSLVIESETTGDALKIEVERKDDGWELDVERDTVYLASATIVGLATFGSLVSIRIIGKPKTHGHRTLGLILMYTGAITVIGYHSFFMYNACCGNINVMQFIGLFVITVLSLGLVAFGSLLILDSGSTEEKKPSSTRK